MMDGTRQAHACRCVGPGLEDTMMLRLRHPKSLLWLAVPLVAILAGPAPAGPCGQDIVRMQARVDAALEARAASGPFAPEGTFATRSDQPTPGTMARAESLYDRWPGGRRAVAALARARAADGRGRLRTCRADLRAAERALKVPGR